MPFSILRSDRDGNLDQPPNPSAATGIKGFMVAGDVTVRRAAACTLDCARSPRTAAPTCALPAPRRTAAARGSAPLDASPAHQRPAFCPTTAPCCDLPRTLLTRPPLGSPRATRPTHFTHQGDDYDDLVFADPGDRYVYVLQQLADGEGNNNFTGTPYAIAAYGNPGALALAEVRGCGATHVVAVGGMQPYLPRAGSPQRQLACVHPPLHGPTVGARPAHCTPRPAPGVRPPPLPPPCFLPLPAGADRSTVTASMTLWWRSLTSRPSWSSTHCE